MVARPGRSGAIDPPTGQLGTAESPAEFSGIKLGIHRQKAKILPEKTGGSPFQITSRVLKETEWTPLVFARHQAETVAKLKEIWDL